MSKCSKVERYIVKNLESMITNIYICNVNLDFYF